jgi:hypothetical protein
VSQCKATANRTGRQCQKRAIKGALVCLSHGAAASQVRRVAAQRTALQRAAELLGPDVQADPAEVLVAAVRASAALLAAGEAAVQADDADATALHELGEAALLAGRLAKLALDSGLEARLARQAERNGQLVGGLITRTINALELPPAASAGVWRIIRAELQAGSLDAGRYANLSIAELDAEIRQVVDELDRFDAADAVAGFPAKLAGCLDAALGVLELDDDRREKAVQAAEQYLAGQAAEREERERRRREQAGGQSTAWWMQPASRNGNGRHP